jgi:Arc/MetJ family transcription regulator
MTRTNIDIDDALIEDVMKQYHLRSKKDAVDFALRTVRIKPMSVDEALAMEGVGWHGDLDELRVAEQPAEL